MSASIERSIGQAEKHRKRGDFEAARLTLDKVLAKYPNNPRLISFSQRLVTEDQSTNADPNYLEIESFNALKELVDQERWIDLIQQCSTIIERKPNCAVVWSFLGLAQSRANFPILAEISYRKAVELGPNTAANQSNLGNHLKKIRKF